MDVIEVGEKTEIWKQHGDSSRSFRDHLTKELRQYYWFLVHFFAFTLVASRDFYCHSIFRLVRV